MAKMRASASYNIMKVASERANISKSFGLGERKQTSYAVSRSLVMGEVPSKTPKGMLLTNANHFSGMGEKTPLAMETNASKDDWGGPEAEKLVIHLKDNFLENIKSYDSLLVYFYTSWCGHCKRLKSIYGEAALKMMKDGIPGHLGAIDVTKRMDIADMFDIVAVPMLKYFRNGQLIMIYNDNRTADAIVKFMKNPPEKPLLVPKIDI